VGRFDMARGRHGKRKPPRSPHPNPFPSAASGVAGVVQRADGSKGSATFMLAGVEGRCVCCGEAHVDKFDTSLMCSLGHTTCFPCVAADVQPHPICSAHCNGFKFKCAECGTWSCVSKTQELAMLCGRHSIAHDRLRKQRILRDDFERPRVCTCRDTSSEPDTPSSEEEEEPSEDDECGGTPATATTRHDAAANEGALLPRVCLIDWRYGHVQRAKRLARLRASLLGCNRVVRG
jgi:hypothetical protein